MQLTAVKWIFNAILDTGLVITLTTGCLVGSLLGSIMTGFNFNYAMNTFVFALSFALIAVIIGSTLAYLIIEKQRRALIKEAVATPEGRKKLAKAMMNMERKQKNEDNPQISHQNK